MTIEWGVQFRTYTDQGWEESRVDTTGFSYRPYTEEQARYFVAAYNRNREDETGLPAARVVKRDVPDWEPA